MLVALFLITSGCLGDGGPSASDEPAPEARDAGAQGMLVQNLSWAPPDFQGDLALYLTVRDDPLAQCTFTFGLAGIFPEAGEGPEDRIGAWFQEDRAEPTIRGMATDSSPEVDVQGTSSSTFVMSGARWAGTASMSPDLAEPFGFFAVGTNLTAWEDEDSEHLPVRLLLSCDRQVHLTLYQAAEGSGAFTSSSAGGGLTVSPGVPGVDAEATAQGQLDIEPQGAWTVSRFLHRVDGQATVNGQVQLTHPNGQEAWELSGEEAFWGLDGAPGAYRVEIDRSAVSEDSLLAGVILGLEAIGSLEEVPRGWKIGSSPAAP